MSDPLFVVEGLNAHYGAAHVLQDVGFQMSQQSLAVVGRNGMGKTTLCNAIVGIQPPSVSGSIRLGGVELVGKPSFKIAMLGVGYVPQGRRLFPSLTVDEHLHMIGRRSRGTRRWTPERVYELFPRLGERRRNGGAQLSGGEQQMLAIGRALLTDPKLLIMDEPSEGLAPTVVESMVETLERLVRDEGMAVLLIEQNLGVATAVAERQLVMVAGRIHTETTAEVLANDSEAQRRFLGVEPLAEQQDGQG